jgi:glyoxylase-like metal-dependent hydrolase (beta-lactamase superfamily II)
MAEPKTRATQIQRLLPWLLHWTLADERIGGFRSDSFAVETAEGLMVIDPLPLEEKLQGGLGSVGGILLTHGNHQRSAWRLRRELGASVYAPAGVTGLDEDPDILMEEQTDLPGGLQAVLATGFQAACYLTFTHADGTGVLFCGDLICHDPGGPYRFPVQEGYFDPAGGREDARRLATLPPTVMCAAHAAPKLDGCQTLLQELAKGPL